jgi:pimeloyl-ACP methyl ester carboxylesterase
MKSKKVSIIIGLGQKKTEYRSLSKYLNIIQPDWNNGSLEKMKLGKPDVLIGFSLGCMIAVMHAEKHRVKKLILCSMTPDETLEKVKADHVIFIAGKKESWIINEINRVAKTLKSTYEIKIIPNADHKINLEYQKELLNII